MILPLSIDPSDFANVDTLSADEVKTFSVMLLSRLERELRGKWKDQILQNLHSTRAEYMKGMFTERPNDSTVVMGVTARESKLAVALELGRPPFDEKEGFMHSQKRHLKRGGGWWLTIPFRHAIPTALGESQAFSNVMPGEIYKLAFRAQGRPLTKQQLPVEHRIPGVRHEISNRRGRLLFPRYIHKAAQYEGLVRKADMAEGRSKGRGKYMTFRRVSDLSDVNSWIHPGFVPRAFLKKSLEKVKTDIPTIVHETKIEFFQNR